MRVPWWSFLAGRGIQIDRAEAIEYEQDLPQFQAALEFVKAARGR